MLQALDDWDNIQENGMINVTFSLCSCKFVCCSIPHYERGLRGLQYYVKELEECE